MTQVHAQRAITDMQADLDAWERKAREAEEALIEAEERVRALEAHVEAGLEAVENARQWVPQHVWTRLWLWKEEAPTTSLARRDAEQQAEALASEAALIYDSPQYNELEKAITRGIADVLFRRASELRRQAEGAE